MGRLGPRPRVIVAAASRRSVPLGRLRRAVCGRRARRLRGAQCLARAAPASCRQSARHPLRRHPPGARGHRRTTAARPRCGLSPRASWRPVLLCVLRRVLASWRPVLLCVLPALLLRLSQGSFHSSSCFNHPTTALHLQGGFFRSNYMQFSEYYICRKNVVIFHSSRGYFQSTIRADLRKRQKNFRTATKQKPKRQRRQPAEAAATTGEVKRPNPLIHPPPHGYCAAEHRPGWEIYRCCTAPQFLLFARPPQPGTAGRRKARAKDRAQSPRL
jgi:hypothetical protein